MGDWENAEKDLIESLKIKPDQAYVINYLAYSWVDKGINLDKGLEMLKKQIQLKKMMVILLIHWLGLLCEKNYIESRKIFTKSC